MAHRRTPAHAHGHTRSLTDPLTHALNACTRTHARTQTHERCRRRRLTRRRRPPLRPAALLLVIGFGAVLLTYSGNLWFSGLHTYSGLPTP